MDDYKKKYEDALENLMLKMKDFDEITINREDVEEIFPELADSEERIRKEFCKDIWTFIPNEKAHKYIAWLEKQNDKRSVLNKEDEKIRKTLIEYFNAYPKDYYGELKKSHILAWLEKQESHITENSAVEPKCIYGRTLEERKRSCKYCSAACEARIKLVDEDLEEAANSYIGHPQEIDEDPAIFSKRKAYIAGAGWKWKRIMEEAIDAEIGSGSISSEAGSVRLVHIKSNAKELKSGDKVKIIIIKEEE